MSTPWWNGPLVAFDLETTGADPEHARIVTAHISAAGIEGESYDWLVNPGIDIPAEASAIHGVSTERAQADGMPAAEAVRQIINTLNIMGLKYPWVAFNAAYDFTVMDREARRYGLEPLVPNIVVDPFVLDKHLDPYRKGRRTLTASCEHYGVELTDAHQASADALAAAALVRVLGERHPFPPVLTLHAAQVMWRAEQCASLEAHFRRTDVDAVVRREWPVLPVEDAA